MRGSAKVSHVCDCGLEVYHFPSFCFSFCVPTVQKASLIAARHCCQYFGWRLCCVGQCLVENRSGCSSPFRAYLHRAFPVELVMSDKVIALRYILHLLSCCNVFVFLVCFASSGMINLSCSLWIHGVHSFVKIIFPLHWRRKCRTDVSQVWVSHSVCLSFLWGLSMEVGVPASSWRYSCDCVTKSPPLSLFRTLPIRSCICL